MIRRSINVYTSLFKSRLSIFMISSCKRACVCCTPSPRHNPFCCRCCRVSVPLNPHDGPVHKSNCLLTTLNAILFPSRFCLNRLINAPLTPTIIQLQLLRYGRGLSPSHSWHRPDFRSTSSVDSCDTLGARSPSHHTVLSDPNGRTRPP